MKLREMVFHKYKSKKTATVLILSCIILAGCSWNSDQSNQPKQMNSNHKDFDKLEKKYDADLGVYAIDTGTGETVTYQANERFAYASTIKALTVGVLLQQKSISDLKQRITYTRDDLVNYNPITKKHVNTGMTLNELCDAALRYSDNAAENLILKQIGGPTGLKKALKKIGDEVTNPVYFEPKLNDVKPGETHDTSTPKALAISLKKFTLGDVLPTKERQLLTNWMKKNTTGDTLIRAGVPSQWEVADKTGSSDYGIQNDIGIIWPPKGEPIVLAILSHRDEKDAASNDKLIAQATKKVINAFNGNHE
ncbi:class A beta-lactamase [Virgibacillus siamensis]|uniref:class A beta-lactamase n=1 Tax=Virgibacillus siamensis TaxID=480071 RepID=UPI0009865DD2|nr:class A beta-lactamase [Virgibacillus siamensis]